MTTENKLFTLKSQIVTLSAPERVTLSIPRAYNERATEENLRLWARNVRSTQPRRSRG